MKKLTLTQVLLLLLIGGVFFVGYGLVCNKSQASKKATPETIVKAEMPLGQWSGVLSAIELQAVKIQRITSDTSVKKFDTAATRKAIDTIRFALTMIVNNINDSARNPILKVK